VTNTSTLLQVKGHGERPPYTALVKIPGTAERILNRHNKTKYNTVITLKLHILPKLITNLQNTADTHNNNGMHWTLSTEFIQFI
jgi:hypothetical protein